MDQPHGRRGNDSGRAPPQHLHFRQAVMPTIQQGRTSGLQDHVARHAAQKGPFLPATQTCDRLLCPAGAKGSLLSVIPPDTPDDGPAAGNARRLSTASSMMT